MGARAGHMRPFQRSHAYLTTPSGVTSSTSSMFLLTSTRSRRRLEIAGIRGLELLAAWQFRVQRGDACHNSGRFRHRRQHDSCRGGCCKQRWPPCATGLLAGLGPVCCTFTRRICLVSCTSPAALYAGLSRLARTLTVIPAPLLQS